jgi:hypothetical protein
MVSSLLRAAERRQTIRIVLIIRLQSPRGSIILDGSHPRFVKPALGLTLIAAPSFLLVEQNF